MDDLNSGNINIDDVSDTLAPKFHATFNSLVAVMESQESKQRLKEIKLARQNSQAMSSGSTATGQKPSHSSQVSVVPAK